VEVTITDDGLLVKRAGMAKLALAQKLAALDLARHGGEAMATCPAGTETM
jgi:antitoxin MazE